MARIGSFEEIVAWQRARVLTRLVYACSGHPAFNRDFGLRDQIRRATVSVMSNIAEGFERDGDREFLQFLAAAKASCGEVRCQLYAALDQGYLTEGEFRALANMAAEVSRLIAGLMKYLQESPLRGRKYRPSGGQARR